MSMIRERAVSKIATCASGEEQAGAEVFARTPRYEVTPSEVRHHEMGR